MAGDKRDESASAHAATLASSDPTVEDTLASAAVAAPAATALGDERPLTHFVRGRELARGGIGRVVVARDGRLGRTVALKLLQRQTPALRARFEREATITARLAHPAIVPIYEAGVLPDGEPFYAMKLVDGVPLDDTIARAADLRARLALLRSALAVCEALAYAHDQRIIHRDLKPANVLVGKFGETVVIDWGLAKDLDARDIDPAAASRESRESSFDREVTLDGEVMGTPSYMPPEQARGDNVDARADVYSLGALLYHVVAGKPPYRGRTAAEVLAAVEAGPPPPIREVVAEVPDDLASIIEKAMAREPAARYAHAGELADELRRYIEGRLVASHRYSGAELVRRWLRKHRTPVAVGAAALVVLAVGAAVSVHKIVVRERETAHALAEARLEQGRQLFVAGDPSAAAPLLAAALDELPDDAVARRLAAEVVRDEPRRLADFDGTTAAFRPDGRELAIGRADGAIDVIDPESGAHLRQLAKIDGKIVAIDYSPDGRLLAVASERGAYVRDAGDGGHVATATTERALDVRFLPAGDLVAIADDRGIVLVDRDGKLVAADRDAAGAHALAISSDGAELAALAHDHAIAWRVPDLSRALDVPPAPIGFRFAVAFTGGALVTAGDDGVRAWSAADRSQPLSTARAVSLATLGSAVLAGGTLIRDGVEPPLDLGPDTVLDVAFAGRSKAVTVGYDRRLRVWDLDRAAAPAVVLATAATPQQLVADASGRRAATRGDAHVELWDIDHVRAPARSLALGAAIDFILGNGRDDLAIHVHAGAVQSTRLVTSALEPIATLDGWPVGFHPDRDEVVTDVDGSLSIYSAHTGTFMRRIVEPEKLWHCAFSPSGTLIATSSAQHVWLRDADWHAIASFPATDVTALALDDDGRVATGHEDGTVHIWDGRAGTLLATARGHSAHVQTLALYGDTLWSDSWDLSLRRWAFPSGESLGVVKQFDRAVEAAARSPDGRWLATVDGTRALALWDTARGRLVDRIPTTDASRALVYVAEDRVIVGGDGGHLELFDLAVAPTAR